MEKYKVGTQIRYDMRFKKPTVRGRGRVRHYAKPQPPVGVRVWRVMVLMLIMSGLWMVCEQLNTPKTKAEAQEVVMPQVENNFESADMPAEPKDLFEKYFAEKSSEARKVAECEANRPIKSKMNRNGTYDYGHFQINTIWLKYYNLTESQILEEETNIQTAKKIYDRTGNWSAWKYSKKCHKLN